MTHHRLCVPMEKTGETLLSFLREFLPSFSSVKAIKRAIDHKQCTVNGRVEWFSTYRVKGGDQIEITLEAPPKTAPAETLYEDQYLLLLNKPAGRVSESFEPYLLVHRLDKETSGVFLLAKTEAMQEKLSALFRKREVKKRYLAICDGVIASTTWQVDNFLGKVGGYQGGVLFGPTGPAKGKRAVTLFQKVKTGKEATLVVAEPITGRTHQIRVHLKGIGHPVLGDVQYAKDFRCKERPPRLMLHALSLAFRHPETGQEMVVEAPLFDDFLYTEKRVFSS